MIVAVAASPSVDVTYVLDTLTPGEIHRPRQVVRLAGGKGINVARAARQLPAEVADTARGAMTEFYPEASPLTLGEWAALEKATAALIALRRPRWLSVSGEFPAGAPFDAVDRLVRLGHEGDARVAVDTHGVALARALSSGADLVKVNRIEAVEVLGGTETDDPMELCRRLMRRGAAGLDVVVTAGVDGAYAMFAGEPPRHAVPQSRGGYPAGSGDSFLAGLVSALASGRDGVEALRLATAAAVANSRIPGAGLLDAGVLENSAR